MACGLKLPVLEDGALGASVCDFWTSDTDLPCTTQWDQDVGNVSTGRGEAKSASTWPDKMQNHCHGVESKLESVRVTQQKISLIIIKV